MGVPRLESAGHQRVPGWCAGLAGFLAVFGLASATMDDARAGEAAWLVAQADVMVFDIQAQPLDTALTAYGRQAGRQIAVDTDLVAGVRSRGVAGTLPRDEALSRLLAGLGMTWRATGPDSIVVEKPAGASDALTLAPVAVVGAGETAWGPVGGYVARRSATGTKTDTPLLETPQSVSVVTREQMDAQGAQRVEQALRYTPGAQVEAFGTDNRASTVFMRGFWNTNVHLDGLKLQNGPVYSTWNVESYGLERVEVLRGPASVLYGQAAPGGVLNLVSKRPVAQGSANAEVTVGSYDYYQGAFDVGGSLNEDDRVLFRLNGLVRDAGSQVDHADETSLFLAPSLTFQPTDDTKITLLGHAERRRSSATVGFLPADGTIRDNPNGRISTSLFVSEPDFDHFDTDQIAIGYEIDHRVNDALSLHQNARYNRLELDYRTVYATGMRADRRTLNRAVRVSDETASGASVDSHAIYKTAHGVFAHTLLAGVDYQQSWNDVELAVGAAPALDAFNPVYGNPVTIPAVAAANELSLRQFGLYLQDQIAVADRWILVLGGRQDWAWTENEDELTGLTTTKNSQKFSGRAGLVYRTDVGVAPYVSYTQSFEPTTTTDANGNMFDPEKAYQYEVGVKYEPPGIDGFITAALFDLHRMDVITYDSSTFVPTQTGEIRSRGIEVEAKLSPIPGLNLIGALAVQNVKVMKSTGADKGHWPQAVPEYSVALWGDYTIQAGDLAGLGFGLGWRRTGRSYGGTTNTITVPAYSLVDASISYRLEDTWRIAVNASNLFDEEYVASCWGTCYYGPRRTVLATIKGAW